jgi:hypothetical protein
MCLGEQDAHTAWIPKGKTAKCHSSTKLGAESGTFRVFNVQIVKSLYPEFT